MKAFPIKMRQFILQILSSSCKKRAHKILTKINAPESMAIWHHSFCSKIMVAFFDLMLSN